VVVSFDEKTSIQALERTQQPLPLRIGRATRHTHEDNPRAARAVDFRSTVVAPIVHVNRFNEASRSMQSAKYAARQENKP
jgi:hypothetical protein